MSTTFKITGLVLAVLAIMVFAGVVIAEETMSHDHMKMEAKTEAKTVTVTGEVIDTACYAAEGAKGEGHAGCANMCISAGQPAGILDAKGNVYIVLGENHKAPSEVVKDVVAKQVKVTGKLIEKGGSKFLVVSKIEKVAEATDKKTDAKSEKKEEKSDKD